MNDDARRMIGLKLKESREYLGISQDEASAVLKISRSAISLIEQGKRKLDSLELMAFAKLYQRPIAFFTDEDYSVELDPGSAVFARSYDSLSESDKKELKQFAEFLSMRSKREDV